MSPHYPIREMPLLSLTYCIIHHTVLAFTDATCPHPGLILAIHAAAYGNTPDLGQMGWPPTYQH